MSDERTIKLGINWTPALHVACMRRCADEFGDPPCWSLAGETRMGDTPEYIEPCTPCAALTANHSATVVEG